MQSSSVTIRLLKHIPEVKKSALINDYKSIAYWEKSE